MSGLAEVLPDVVQYRHRLGGSGEWSEWLTEKDFPRIARHKAEQRPDLYQVRDVYALHSAETARNARRYEWLRERADSVIDWDFMPPCSREFSPLENGCSNTLDHCIDAAIDKATSL